MISVIELPTKNELKITSCFLFPKICALKIVFGISFIIK